MSYFFSTLSQRINLTKKKKFIPLALIGYLSLKKYLNWLPGLSCPLRHATGVPCPTCFLTRSVSASLTGNLGEALEYHLFGPPIAVFLVWWMFYTLKTKKLIPSRLNVLYISIFIAMIFIYWIVRLVLNIFFQVPSFPLEI